MPIEAVVFSPDQMSKLDPAAKANILVQAMRTELGSDLLRGGVMVVPVEDGAVVSRMRPYSDAIDIRVQADDIRGRIYGSDHARTGTYISPATAFRHVLGMAQDMGIPVELPANHQAKSLRIK